MYLAKTFGLFVVTAIAEIVGCYLPYLWLKKGATAWVLVPAILSLALFVWLLTLHPPCGGPDLRGVRRGLHWCGDFLAVGGGRGAPDDYGSRRRGDFFGRHGGHNDWSQSRMTWPPEKSEAVSRLNGGRDGGSRMIRCKIYY